MFEELREGLHDLHRVCEKKLGSDDLLLLDNNEMVILFRARELSERLADTIFELGTIFYKNKILV